MGVKLQLLLGLLLICSTCGSEENTTNSHNASLENVDSTNNYIEKLPKTDTQINLVNKDTQDNSDNVKTLQNNLENDTHYNQTSTNIKDQISNSEDQTVIKGEKPDQEDSDINESNGSKNDRKGREDSSRSIDIEKYDSHEFHNNDYSSSNSQKLFENSIRKASTKRFMDFSEFEPTTSRTFFEETKQKQKSSSFQLTSPETFFKFEEAKLKHKYQLTTPKTPKNFYDTKYEEDKQKLEQEYEESAQNIDHVSDEIDDINDDQIHKLFGETKHKPNSSLDYKEKTKISKNNTINDGSEYNELRVETTHNINYDSVYNFTSSDEDDTEKMETTSQKEKQETTSPRGFVVTTKKTISLTKPPTGQNNHILSNKIESETIKAINFLTTEFSTTKRLKEENDLVPNEQTVEENKIIPLQTLLTTTTEVAAKSTNDTEPSTTTEQTKDTTQNPSSKNIVNFHIPTTEQTEQTTEIKDQINETTTTESYTETSTNNWNYISKLSNTEPVTEQTTTGEDDNQTTTEQKSKSVTTDVADTTTTESNTIIPTTVEIKEQTTEQNYTTELFTSEQLTTENLNRISKAFAFESTHAETTEVATTETIIKLSPTQEVNSTADDLTVIMTGAINETTTEIVTPLAEVKTNKTEYEITSTEVGTEFTTMKMVEPKIFETSTSALNDTTEFDTTSLKPSTDNTNLLTSTKIIKDNDNISTIDVARATTKKNFDTTLVPNTNDVTSPTPTFVPVLTNVSVSTEESSEHTTAEDSSESSSNGSDIGGLGTNDDNKGKIAAIVISTVGAVCLILLAGLLYVMRKRQRRFNYKQRCRPVGLDDYSVDNVSGYNSTRRKVERQSKRSYGNPAFDDPVAVTHPLNFPALAKFATNTDDIKAEFQEVPQITAKTNELPEGCETKNRYANVIPLPETRVFLQTIDGYPNSDYINANYVTGPKNTKGYYIACQGPMTNTVDDFWRMVWEQQSKVILMLTHLFENGVEKCVDYLPPSEVLDCNRLFGDFQVTLKKRDVKEKYIISNLQLKNMVSNSWREITHFWYLGWPEKGVPSEENSIIAFLIEARSYMKSATLDKNAATNGNINGPSKNEVNPVVVHCSPGTGRTGVVIACDIAIREFEQTRLVDIPKIVYKIRRDRASAVQTKEQYMFIYKVVSLYATKLTGGALDSF